MKILRSLLLSLAFLALVAPLWVHPQTQPELNIEACEEYRKADEELNKTYNQILVLYSDETEFIEKLKSAQRAWITFRNLHLESIFPKTNRSQYGSVKPMCRCIILAELTNERTRVLKGWLEGTEEGNVCAGSVKTKAQLQRPPH